MLQGATRDFASKNSGRTFHRAVTNIMRTALNRNRSRIRSPLSDIEECTNNNTSVEESLEPQTSGLSHGNNSLISRVNFLLRQNNDGANGRNNNIIKLLKDIVSGILFGALGMSVLLLLDYGNIINLETARVFRRTASEIFNNPEIFESIGGDLDKRVISLDAYNAMQKELSDSKVVIESEYSIFTARSTKDANLKAELATLKKEYDTLIQKAGLDVFCPHCKWGMGMSCQQRVNYMLESYSDTANYIECVNKLVEEGKTKKRCLLPSF